MEIHHLHALRLGFSTHEAKQIKSHGLSTYVSKQLDAKYTVHEPDFLLNTPKSFKELRALRIKAEKGGKDLEDIAKAIISTNIEFKSYLLERFYTTPYPLREKINLYFQNHFVVTLKGVGVPYWTFQHYKTINDHSLGNYKKLVKAILHTNAMVKYLDNHQNRKYHNNENLARELLELFTLGEGFYSESDIKNVATALAGLTFGRKQAHYRPMLKDNGSKTIFGKTGNFNADTVVDLIFKQANVATHLVTKVLKWFFYDNPPQETITYYASYLENNNFELKPFFKHLMVTECDKAIAGTQIKNPLTFLFQIYKDLNLEPHYKLMSLILHNQSMDIYNQPNVKGWNGGSDWLTVQIYNNRKELVDFITSGGQLFQKRFQQKLMKSGTEKITFAPKIKLNNPKDAHSILTELSERTIFKADAAIKAELDQLLTNDFDPNSDTAHRAILHVYNYLAKTPEFQII